jgi:uncharacterized protein (DUF362 family)
MTKSWVAAVRTRPETVLADIERLSELAGMKEALQPSARTILKDNISWHLFFPGANTTPWQLEGTIRALKHYGFDDMIAVHNKTVVTQAFKGGKLNRLTPVYDHYKIPHLYNFNPDDIQWEVYKPHGPTPALDRIFPDGVRIPKQFHGTNIVHLPTVKCHIYTNTTGAMKNAFGGLLNTRRHYTHSVIHRTLVDLLRIQKEIHTGLFAIMDGTFAGNGPGPRTMRPEQKDILLASADQTAIDAVAAKLMGFDPMSLQFIRDAHDEKLGIGDTREIELVGDDISNESWGFSVGDNMASRVGDLLWFGPLHRIQKLFFHTPLVHIFVFGSFVYHDYVWYPLHSRKWIDQFNNSPWGRMFEDRYGKRGSLIMEDY